MKILHISEYCHAGGIGGTERYLLELIRGMQLHGVESQIGWLSSDDRKTFESEGIQIHSLPKLAMRVDEPPMELVFSVRELFETFRPDAVHFHTFGLAEAAIARMVQQQNIPYVFYYHSASWMCRRGDLLIWGGPKLCNGQVQTLRCSACKVQERIGGPALGGYLGAILSAPLDWLLRNSPDLDFRRRVCFLSDTQRFHESLVMFLGGCNLVISCSEWGRPILIANGAQPERIVKIPQGVPQEFIEAASWINLSQPPKTPAVFTIAYVGRVTPLKGVDILAEAVSRLTDQDIRLVIYGFDENEMFVAELNRQLAGLARQDARIELRPKLALAQMAAAYAEVDLVAIPSVTLETGPFVIFEAMQMGIPVFGSNRLGHLELLRQAGQVIEPNNVQAWQQALTSALAEFRKGEWTKRRTSVKKQKLDSMKEVAGRILQISTINQLTSAQ